MPVPKIACPTRNPVFEVIVMRFCPLAVEEVAVVMLSETADTVVPVGTPEPETGMPTVKTPTGLLDM